MRSNIYDDVKLLKGTSVNPQSVSGASAVNGSSVDTEGADNGAIYAYADAASGTPTTASLAVKVQESSDGATGWADALDNSGAVIGFTLTVTSAAAENVARIEGLNLNRKRYLRAVVTPTFTGGTSPASVAVAQIILGNNQQLPVDSAASNT